VSVKDFGAVGDGTTDDTAAIQAALDAAYALFIGNVTSISGFTFRKGGATVYMPPGQYLTTSTLEFKEGVTLQGAGRWSTVIKSSYNGTILRNATPAAYNTAGMGIRDLCVQGDRTKASQIGIALLRDFEGVYSNVTVIECGSHGWRLYECLGGQYQNIEALKCVGHGLYITDGIGSWASPTPSNLPTNNASFYDFHAQANDGAGIYLGRIGTGSGVNGCRFFGGACEYNYYSSAAGVGYNVEIRDISSYFPNTWNKFWIEDTKVLAHVYIETTDVQENVHFLNFMHFGNGAGNYPQKAIIVAKGKLLLDSPIGSGNLYRTYLGSNAPFQLTKATGSIYANNILGSGLTLSQPQIVDETGASSGLENNVRVNTYGNTWGGPWTFNNDFGTGGPYFNQNGQAFPYAEMSNFYKGIMFGPGTAAADAGLTRIAANVLGPMSGDSFQVGGIAGETLKFNADTANGAVATTLGSVGPTGSTAGNPGGWLRINVNGTDRYVPYW
jgi:hypothetical protein